MAVPTQLSDLSATAASNSPAGTDTVGTTMDDFIRAHASIIARISAGTDALATPALGAATATTVNKITFTQPATGATVTIGNGKTLTVNGNTTLNTGISDTATAVALSLSGSGANSIAIANSATNPTIGTTAGSLSLTSAVVTSSTLTVGTNLFANGYGQINSNDATPAGGGADHGLFIGSGGVGLTVGSGLPTSVVADGSIYFRTDGGSGTTIYQRRAGNWVATAA